MHIDLISKLHDRAYLPLEVSRNIVSHIRPDITLGNPGEYLVLFGETDVF